MVYEFLYEVIKSTISLLAKLSWLSSISQSNSWDKRANEQLLRITNAYAAIIEENASIDAKFEQIENELQEENKEHKAKGFFVRVFGKRTERAKIKKSKDKLTEERKNLEAITIQIKQLEGDLRDGLDKTPDSKPNGKAMIKELRFMLIGIVAKRGELNIQAIQEQLKQLDEDLQGWMNKILDSTEDDKSMIKELKLMLKGIAGEREEWNKHAKEVGTQIRQWNSSGQSSWENENSNKLIRMWKRYRLESEYGNIYNLEKLALQIEGTIIWIEQIIIA